MRIWRKGKHSLLGNVSKDDKYGISNHSLENLVSEKTGVEPVAKRADKEVGKSYYKIFIVVQLFISFSIIGNM